MTKKKYKVGLTFGVYDLFHIGHLNILKNAKGRCEKLIVCVSDDEYILKHKGRKPIIPFDQRFKIMMALSCVDDVDIQSLSFGKKEAVDKYKPDVLFVGDDWSTKTYTGMNLGVKVIFLPHTRRISSTIIKNKICRMK